MKEIAYMDMIEQAELATEQLEVVLEVNQCAQIKEIILEAITKIEILENFISQRLLGSTTTENERN